jgi:hypothetical protein
MFHLIDVNGNHTSTGNPPGFVDHTLSSRGFVVKSNVTKSSTTSSSTTSSPTSCSSQTAKSECSNSLSGGAKAGIAVSAAVAFCAIAALIGVLLWKRQSPANMPDAVAETPIMGMKVNPIQQTALHELPAVQRQYELSNKTSQRGPYR